MRVTESQIRELVREVLNESYEENLRDAKKFGGHALDIASSAIPYADLVKSVFKIKQDVQGSLNQRELNRLQMSIYPFIEACQRFLEEVNKEQTLKHSGEDLVMTLFNKCLNDSKSNYKLSRVGDRTQAGEHPALDPSIRAKLGK